MSASPGGLRRLARPTDGRAAAPVRMVHLGLGNFFRAHAAWYTDRATDASDWGIAAFTGRSPATAVSMAEQDGLYTLVVRGPQEPELSVVASLSAVHPADDLAALRDYLARPEVGVVTLTVTEAGYRRGDDGGLDLGSADVTADLAALTDDPMGGVVTTVPGKLVAGLLARRAAGAGPIAIVPNDNVPDNGAMVSRVVTDLAAQVDPSLPAWVAANVSFVTTMVDRITPRTTDADLAVVAEHLGVDDPQAVTTEPFTEWVLAGDFPAGRPAWESSGASLVADVEPFEQRKLWLLNGAHSLLAYAGGVLGHETVAQAVADPVVLEWVQQWWNAASRHLTLPADHVAAYRSALLERFANPQIHHRLEQIAADGSLKIPIRAVPVIEAELRDGRVDPGATRLVAAWIVQLRGAGVPVTDARADEVQALVAGDLEAAVERTLRWLGLDDAAVGALVLEQAGDLGAHAAF